MKYLLVIIPFLFLQATNNPSCTCMPLTIEEQIDLADIIFKGKVVSIDTLLTVQSSIHYGDDGSKKEYFRPIEMTRTKLKVVQSIKGTSNLDSAFVYTTWQCCMCGFPFWPDQTYLVFANLDTIRVSKEREIKWDQKNLVENLQKPEKVLLTTICSGSDEFTPEQLEVILKYLHRRKNIH